MIADKQAPVSHQHRASSSQRVSWSQCSALLPGNGPEGRGSGGAWGGKLPKMATGHLAFGNFPLHAPQRQGHNHCRGVV